MSAEAVALLLIVLASATDGRVQLLQQYVAGVYGRIILKWILLKLFWTVWTGFISVSGDLLLVWQ